MNAIPEYVAFFYYAGTATAFLALTALATYHMEQREQR